MAVIYGAIFPLAWIVANRETERRIRKMKKEKK